MPDKRADVAIIMGSQSDWATMRHAAETLDALGISHDDRIVSAHRTPAVSSPLPKARARMVSRSLLRAPAALHIFPGWQPR